MKVSIVITAYNVEQWIRQAVMSALNQKHIESDQPDWQLEVVVVNDASTDSTGSILGDIASGGSILGDIASEHNTLRIITNPTNQGAGMSRRIGIEASTGDYILLLDGDDWLQPTMIASLAYSAQRYDADIASGGITIMRNEKIGYFDQTCYGNFIAEHANKVTNFYRERIVFMNNKLIRRRLHDLVPYCERRYIEDTPVIARMLYYANKVVYTNNPGYVYRMQPQSLTHTAGRLKGAIFRALCVMDLVEFYRDKGEPYTELFNIAQFYKVYNELKRINLTTEENQSEIRKYPSEVQTINAYAEEHLEEWKSTITKH